MPGEVAGQPVKAPSIPLGMGSVADPIVRGSSLMLNMLVALQIVLNLVELGLSLELVASLPVGLNAPAAIAFAIFVGFFSILTWFHILVVDDHFGDKYLIVRRVSYIGLVLCLIFYFSASLVMTTGIAPAGSCTDSNYTDKNKLIQGGGPSKCHLIHANIAILWIGALV
jgi:hypothetical protein